jgi:hypothetical protein
VKRQKETRGLFVRMSSMRTRGKDVR